MANEIEIFIEKTHRELQRDLVLAGADAETIDGVRQRWAELEAFVAERIGKKR